MTKIQLPYRWSKETDAYLDTLEFQKTRLTVEQAYQNNTIFPPKNLIFKAFETTPLKSIKLVILGQDPYPTLGNAHGLSFSVPSGQPIPGSLKNIFKEIKTNDPLKHTPFDGNLENWAKQGVFLLNSCLTVKEGKPGSHQSIGWSPFTNLVIKTISSKQDNVVFFLWGKHAQQKETLISKKNQHLVLQTSHPSPLSAYRGFLGSGHFKKCNEYLISKGEKPIIF